MTDFSKLKGYMDWYCARMENVHNILMDLSEKLKERGCRVYSTKWRSAKQDDWRSYIVVTKGNLRTYVGFHQVPYGWYADSECSTSHLRGLVGEYGFGFPYTVDEILDSMRPCYKKLDEFYVEI